jgi:integrase/recombinase XerD
MDFEVLQNLENPSCQPTHLFSYRQAIEARQEIIWKNLASVNLEEAVYIWLDTIQNPCTKKSYYTSIKELFHRKFLDASWTLQTISLISLDPIIDRIKTEPLFSRFKKGTLPWSSKTREARISCLLSLSRYLSRKTSGLIQRGTPNKDGIGKTFSPKPRKVKTEAIARASLNCFFEHLEKISHRDSLIAKLCLHGAKRISEVLDLQTDQINFEKRQITFKQAKSKLSDDFTIISFEKPSASILFDQLKYYIKDRNGLVFLTIRKKRIQKTQIDRNFAKAGRRAGIPFRVSPHNLRATAVTLWKEDGFSDSMIMLATGHSSSEMVHRYDKSDIANNVTRKSCLLP